MYNIVKNIQAILKELSDFFSHLYKHIFFYVNAETYRVGLFLIENRTHWITLHYFRVPRSCVHSAIWSLPLQISEESTYRHHTKGWIPYVPWDISISAIKYSKTCLQRPPLGQANCDRGWNYSTPHWHFLWTQRLWTYWL